MKFTKEDCDRYPSLYATEEIGVDETNNNYEEKDKEWIEKICTASEGLNTVESMPLLLNDFLRMYATSPRYQNYMNEHDIEKDQSFKKLFWIIDNMEILQEFMDEHMKSINKFLYGRFQE